VRFECATSVSLPSGARIDVSGAYADEVERVARALLEDTHSYNFADRFLDAVDRKLQDESTPGMQKKRLRRLRDSATGVSRDVLAEVIAAVVTRQTGL
jgi:hypothetical protein